MIEYSIEKLNNIISAKANETFIKNKNVKRELLDNAYIYNMYKKIINFDYSMKGDIKQNVTTEDLLNEIKKYQEYYEVHKSENFIYDINLMIIFVDISFKKERKYEKNHKRAITFVYGFLGLSNEDFLLKMHDYMCTASEKNRMVNLDFHNMLMHIMSSELKGSLFLLREKKIPEYYKSIIGYKRQIMDLNYYNVLVAYKEGEVLLKEELNKTNESDKEMFLLQRLGLNEDRNEDKISDESVCESPYIKKLFSISYKTIYQNVVNNNNKINAPFKYIHEFINTELVNFLYLKFSESYVEIAVTKKLGLNDSYKSDSEFKIELNAIDNQGSVDLFKKFKKELIKELNYCTKYYMDFVDGINFEKSCKNYLEFKKAKEMEFEVQTVLSSNDEEQNKKRKL